jgi:hypothetical protein
MGALLDSAGNGMVCVAVAVHKTSSFCFVGGSMSGFGGNMQNVLEKHLLFGIAARRDQFGGLGVF